MKLHFRGIEVPALGSPRDIVYRNYLIYEAKLEAKKHQMLFLIGIGTPTFTDSSEGRKWDKQTKRVFDEYVTLLLGQEVVPVNSEEERMKEFYEKVISKSKPKLFKDREGKLKVENLPRFKFKEETNKDKN